MTQTEYPEMVSKHIAHHDMAESDTLRNKPQPDYFRTYENFPEDGFQQAFHSSTHLKPSHSYSQPLTSAFIPREGPRKRKRAVEDDDGTTKGHADGASGELPSELRLRCQNATELTLKACNADMWSFWQRWGSQYRLLSNDLAYFKIVSTLPAKFQRTGETPEPKRARKSGNSTSRTYQPSRAPPYQEIPYKNHRGSIPPPQMSDYQNPYASHDALEPLTDNLRPIDSSFFTALQPASYTPALAPRDRVQKGVGATSASKKRLKRVKARKTYSGFLPREHPLPRDWEDLPPEVFAEHYPNHLFGDVLRRYSARKLRDTWITKHLHWHAKAQLAKDANYLRKWMIVEDKIEQQEKETGERNHDCGYTVGDYYHPALDWYSGPEKPLIDSELPIPPGSNASIEKAQQEPSLDDTKAPHEGSQNATIPTSKYPIQHPSPDSSNITNQSCRESNAQTHRSKQRAEHLLQQYRNNGFPWEEFGSLQHMRPEKAATTIEDQYSSFLQQDQCIQSPRHTEPLPGFLQEPVQQSHDISSPSSVRPLPPWRYRANAASYQPYNEFGYSDNNMMSGGWDYQSSMYASPYQLMDPSNAHTMSYQPQAAQQASIDPRLIEGPPTSYDTSLNSYFLGD
ncbi:MAG: hypothetical protein Q9160_004257 [Pyrenula sp. 1 TL-2023]